MSTPNEKILEGVISHSVWLERYKAGEIRRIMAVLNRAEADLVEQIAARLEKIGRGAVLSKAETERLETLLKRIRDAYNEIGDDLTAASTPDMIELAAHEADHMARLIETAATVDLTRPSASQLRAVALSRPFQGRLLKEWYSDLAEGQQKRVRDAIRIGITEGQTTDQIVRRLRGTRAARYQDGILEIGRRQAAAVVRTAVAHVSAAAAEEIFAVNDDVIEGVQYIATLDSRTTQKCASRDGKVYELAKKPQIPAHFNCRSRYVPYLGRINSEGTRSAIGGPVPRSMTYDDWLRKQPQAVQEDVLGQRKARLFREGMKLDRFVNETGREYTLDELRLKDRELFDRVL